MRARLAIIVGLLTAVFGVHLIQLAPQAGAGEVVLAQEVGESPGEANVEEGAETDPKAETSTEEGTGEAAEPEAGPPWTYQMARMALGMLFLALLAVGFTYYQFVYRRQKGVA